jgi:hypothetical protein
MTPREINRALDFRFEAYAGNYWCFAVSDDNKRVFMIQAECCAERKVRARMAIIARYILNSFPETAMVMFPCFAYTRKSEFKISNIKQEPVMEKTNEKASRTLASQVKEAVDYIYNYLIQSEDGVTFSASSLGKIGSRVCTVLVKRGIVEKTHASSASLGKRGALCKYKWVATMAPTKVLYGSITDEIADIDKKYKDKSRKKKLLEKKAKKEEEPIEVTIDQLGEEATLDFIPESVIFDTIPSDEDIKAAWPKLVLEYGDRPRLWSTLKNADLDIVNIDGKKTVYFSVTNEAQAVWIREKLIGDLETSFRNILGSDEIYLRVFRKPEEQKPIKFELDEKTKKELAPIAASLLAGTIKIDPDAGKVVEGIKKYSDQELWDELKARGYFIKEERLAIVKTTFLD